MKNLQIIQELKFTLLSTSFILIHIKTGVVSELETNPLEEPEMGADGSYCISVQTSQGKIELKIYDYVQYKKWITTMNHMLMRRN